MSDQNEDNLEPITRLHIQETIDNTELEARKIQQLMIEGAQSTGFIAEKMNSAKGIYLDLLSLANEHPELQPVVASGVFYISTLGQELANLRENIQDMLPNLNAAAFSASTVISTSSTSVMAFSSIEPEKYLPESPPFIERDEAIITAILTKLDPSLAKVYEEVWQAYYGTTADNIRAAIALMRQVFDYFFDVLAPDDKVRGSPYWKIKDGDNPNQVYRRERIEYAIHTHVTDNARATTLSAGLDHILKTYKVLNGLHSRGELKVPETKQALFAIKQYLEEFADALGI